MKVLLFIVWGMQLLAIMVGVGLLHKYCIEWIKKRELDLALFSGIGCICIDISFVVLVIVVINKCLQ